MGRKFRNWLPRSASQPADYRELASIILENREFHPIEKLDYGDHGLLQALETVSQAIAENRRIALYADYDVDGTMSCVSWIWFLRAIGYRNFVHYIPCRFKEGYGLNLKAIAKLIDEEKAEVVITMDTGITANEEAAYCRSRGVTFVCTDHHKIQRDKMPDCIILNPKLHPDATYQELCGCGITFVLLRKLARRFEVPPELWTDLLALAGMATICDVVPLNGVNHRLAKLGVDALVRSRRPVLQRLLAAGVGESEGLDESHVGFRLGPRINAVGRLEHADLVVRAFVDEDPQPLIDKMGECNLQRKAIQEKILREAREAAEAVSGRVLFLGGDWHPGVVGIAASRIAEEFWRPTWLFQRKDGLCKGSARSIPGFDVTDAMASTAARFRKFGGHAFAGGFTFEQAQEQAIRDALEAFAAVRFAAEPSLWESCIKYDCRLPIEMASLELADALSELKPFGNGFEEPRFHLEAPIANVEFYYDKTRTERKHTAVHLRQGSYGTQKIMFFNEVLDELTQVPRARFVVSASRNVFRGRASLSLVGVDYEI